MTDLFYGGEIGSVVPSSGGVFEYEEASEARYEHDHARCAIKIADHNSYAESPSFSGQAEVWFHWRSYWDSSSFSSAANCFVALAGSTAQVRITAAQAGSSGDVTMSLEYLSGASWVAAGTFSAPRHSLNTFDVYINKTSGALQLYSSGTLVIDASGLTLSGLSDFTKCRWHGAYLAAAYISELAASTVSTVGMGISTRYPSGNGANTAWTGTYADVDEVVYNDADAISSAAGNDVETYTHSGATLGSFVVRGVAVAARAKKGSSGPTGLQGAIRIGSTDYFGSTQTLGSGYGAHVTVWETDPSTSVAFVGADIASMQFGVKSIT